MTPHEEFYVQHPGSSSTLDAALARIAVLEAVVRELREELAQAQNAASVAH